jgi:hypothetical protein
MKKFNWKIVLVVFIVLLLVLWLVFWKKLFPKQIIYNPGVDETLYESSEIIDLDSWSPSLETLLWQLD